MKVISRFEVSYSRVIELDVHGVHKVSLQFQKFITKANEKTGKWKLLQNETYMFKFFFMLPHSIHLCMGIISCTKHIKTLLDFLHDRRFPRMFLVVHSSLYRTNPVPVCINFSCHARIDGTLLYLVLKFRRVCRSDLVSINHNTHCAFS